MNNLIIKKYRKISWVGMIIFIVGILLMILNMKNAVFATSGLLVTLIGWYVFSKYHTKIAIINLKEITRDYFINAKKV